MNQSLITLFFGFLLGIEHAFEADHMVAISTMVTQHQNPLKAALIGTFWGIGHTTTLFIVGIIVLLLKIQIPAKFSLTLEMLVGFMLVFLGVRVLVQRKDSLHTHQHKHDDQTHIHAHFHESHKHWHKHSFLIGLIHGLAGSGTLMILVLSTIRDIFQGIYYILLFGIGSILGMTIISFAVGIPFILSMKRFPVIENYLRIVAGILSIGFGISIVYGIGIIGGLFSSLM